MSGVERTGNSSGTAARNAAVRLGTKLVIAVGLLATVGWMIFLAWGGGRIVGVW